MRKQIRSRKMKTLFILLFVFAPNIICPANLSKTNDISYFPLNVGNIYFYHFTNSYHVPDSIKRTTIEKDTIINGVKYYWLNNSPKFVNGWYRVDSITSSLYQYDTSNTCLYYNHESFKDSLSAQQNDVIKYCNNPWPSYQSYICAGEDSTTIFSENILRKTFKFTSNQQFNSGTLHTYYAKNFGIIEYSSSWMGHFLSTSWNYTLRGCVLNGVVYGDTSYNPVGIVSLSSESPASYKLHQNYPNPFNPVTNINFDIPKSSHIKLVIYDASGQEVGLLVNEELNPGNYQYQWDGSSLSSGIYFYKLSATDGAGNFVETKKMVLIK